jgi:hypothetical protein
MVTVLRWKKESASVWAISVSPGGDRLHEDLHGAPVNDPGRLAAERGTGEPGARVDRDDHQVRRMPVEVLADGDVRVGDPPQDVRIRREVFEVLSPSDVAYVGGTSTAVYLTSTGGAPTATVAGCRVRVINVRVARQG